MLLSSRGAGHEGRMIQEGDLIIIYESHDRMKAVQVSAKDTLQNRFGSFKHSDWIGRPFGSKVKSCNSGGFVHLLAPTPELWTLVLQHRTQILYAPDISLVVSFLELQPGSVVLEAGTGSGSLTTCLARAIAPTGHVHTFEFHEPRATAAREEFARNGLGDLVTVRVRDVESLGLPAELAGQADAVFLDLPGPWNAVPSAARVLRPDAPFCSFSPCIEQVQRTCEELAAHGFTDIRTFEILLRTYDVRSEPSITQLLDPGASTLGGQHTDLLEPAQKRPRLEGQAGDGKGGAQSELGLENGKDAQTASQPNELHGMADSSVPVLEAKKDGSNGATKGKKASDTQIRTKTSTSSSAAKVVVARPTAETRGHTGYLTFARHAS